VSSTAIDSSYFAFLTFSFVLAITPGATTAVVIRNTLEGGRRAGYVTALGAAAGSCIIAIACALGLSVLIAMWPGSLDAIRIGGAIFLAWLGLRSLYRAWTHADGGIRLALDGDNPAARARVAGYFGDGLAIHLLSPVLISYYLTVVPSFVPVNASRFYYPGLAATHVGVAMLCHSLWATALDALRRWLVQPWRRRLLQAGSGAALLALALRIVL
jgi:threonine/homoserine/homoserine lactone efflux protein